MSQAAAVCMFARILFEASRRTDCSVVVFHCMHHVVELSLLASVHFCLLKIFVSFYVYSVYVLNDMYDLYCNR